MRAAIQHSIKLNNIHRAIDLFPERPRVRYQLSSRQYRDPQMEIESQTVPFTLPPFTTNDARHYDMRIISVFNIDKRVLLTTTTTEVVLFGRRCWLNFGKRLPGPDMDICEMPSSLVCNRGKR